MSIPSLFRCPISLDLFADPVTLSTGQTYDRPSIEKWLADGNLTCPVTMQRLCDTSLVPNLTLRHLIGEWLLAGPAKSSSGPYPTEPLSALKKVLQSGDTDDEVKVETLRKLRILSVESDTGKACLVQSGFFPLVLQLLLDSTPDTDPDILDLALDCVLHLSPAAAHSSSLDVLKEESNLARLVLLLEQGRVRMQIKLCSLIETVASETRELCTIFGGCRRLLQVLVSLLLCQYSDASTAAVGAISSICSLEANRENVVRDGGVDGLVAHLSDSVRGNPVPALATLEALLQLETGRKALLKRSNGVRVLVGNVFRVSSSSHGGSGHAVGSLLAVCGSSRRARMEAVSCGVVAQLLMLIQSRCGPEVKTKARALLKVFKFVWG